jgi:hypothetical protein
MLITVRHLLETISCTFDRVVPFLAFGLEGALATKRSMRSLTAYTILLR